MLSNTATIEDQRITFAKFSVENQNAERFTIRDGWYVGQDGFVVPKDFEEFHEQFPQYVRNWVSATWNRVAQEREALSAAPSIISVEGTSNWGKMT
jgi:hypothetical protein